MELIHLFAMSAAFDAVLQSYIPPISSVGFFASPYTCLIRGRGIVRTCAPEFTLMWTTVSNNPDDAFDPNHIVLLAPSPAEEVSLESSYAEDDRTCNYTSLDAEATPLDDASDFSEHMRASDAESDQSIAESANAETSYDEHVEVGSAARDSEMFSLHGSDFLTTQTVMNILQNPESGMCVLYYLQKSYKYFF